LWRHTAVLHAARAYRAAYGSVLLPAGGEPGSDVGPDQIAASAGWTPPLTPAQELLLAELAHPGQGLADFTARLDASAGGGALAAAWRRALTGRPAQQDGLDQKEDTSS
jgi:hypothetical protein